MSSDQEEASHTIVVGEDLKKVLLEKPTMGSLQLMRRGSAPETQQLDLLWRLGWGSPPRVLIMSVES